jgi:protocatechuate 3,4-dioxygenase beta subunit
MNDRVNRKRRNLLLGIATLPVSGLTAATISTPSASEGPFYPTSKMRFGDTDNDLVKITPEVEEAGGEVVILKGQVLDKASNPIVGARVEIWQCDVNGRYLHKGDPAQQQRDPAFQGFGHDLSAVDGSYSFRTIKPVRYTGRAPHIHVKVLVNSKELLTTQFYLPNHPDNAKDWLYQRVPQTKRELITMNFNAAHPVPQAILDIVI